MDTPIALDPVKLGPDTYSLPTYFPIPGMGVLPMNAFVIRAAEPVLIDTGPGPLRGDFVERLARVVDPEDLRYVWLTHTDPDHVGALEDVLRAAPRARVVTTFLGAGKLGLLGSSAAARTYLLNPGQELDLGDRRLRAMLPPVYDAPETLAAFDGRQRALFSADCFGALLAEPREDTASMSDGQLLEGLVTWARVDAPWLECADPGRFEAALGAVRRLSLAQVFGSHTPPAFGDVRRLLAGLQAARGLSPFVGPDQRAVEAVAAE